MIVNEYRVLGGHDETVPKLIWVMIAQLCEHARIYWIVDFKRMNCMECEFYLRSWWPSVDGRWPILQQDEDTRVLILGSEPCVDLPLRGRGRTAQRTHQEIKLGSNPRAAEFVMVESQARIRKPRSILGRSWMSHRDRPTDSVDQPGLCIWCWPSVAHCG